MKIILTFFCFFYFSNILADENLKYYVEKALSNNLQLKAERKKYEAANQTKNISRSEFLPSLTLSNEQTSVTSTNHTNTAGANLEDSNLDTESKSILL